MTNARPTKPQRIRTTAGHIQTYHTAVGPKPMEAVATLTKPDPQPLAPAAATTTTTTSETGLVTIQNEDGIFTYFNNAPHSENDEPSHRRSDGSLAWHQYGEPHRVGGPSSVDPDGSEAWYTAGWLHRDGGLPAVTHRNGDQEFYLMGVRFESAAAAKKASTEQIELKKHVRDLEEASMTPSERAEIETRARVATRDDTKVSAWAKSGDINARLNGAEAWGTANADLDFLLRDRNPHVRGSAALNLARRERILAAESAGE